MSDEHGSSHNATEGETDRPLWRRAVSWCVTHWQVAITIAGLITYGYLRLTYDLFYGTFGLRPEDVGLGYADVLAQTVLGLIVFLTLWAVLGLIWTGLMLSMADDIRSGWRRIRSGSETRPNRHRTRASHLLDLMAVVLPVLMVLAAVVALPLIARSDAQAIVKGQRREATLGELRIASWGANWAAVTGAAPEEACLLYLGRDGTLGAFWDPTRRRTLLLDLGDGIMLAEDPADLRCRPP